jgi:hypothetical protein
MRRIRPGFSADDVAAWQHVGESPLGHQGVVPAMNELKEIDNHGRQRGIP